MKMYFEFEDLASIRKQLGSLSYAKGLIAAGLPIATVALTKTQSYSYKVFTGELRDLCHSPLVSVDRFESSSSDTPLLFC